MEIFAPHIHSPMHKLHHLSLFLLYILWAISHAQSPPNIIVFIVDDMGWTDSAIYGSTYYHTPHIDALARRGMLFTDAYVPNPSCSPSRASMLTGKYPSRFRITQPDCHLPPRDHSASLYEQTPKTHLPYMLPESRRFLDPRQSTVPRVLRSVGYTTAHFGKWHLGVSPEHWPEHYGFDYTWHGTPDSGPPLPHGYFSPYSFRNGSIQSLSIGEYIVDDMTTRTVDFIKKNYQKKFFISVSHYGVHAPWQAPDPLIREFVGLKDPSGVHTNPIMAAMLKSIDNSLGQLVKILTELDILDNTLIWFTSDNGGCVSTNSGMHRLIRNHTFTAIPSWISTYEAFAGTFPPTSNSPLRAGKGSIYEGGVRVPLIAFWPNRISPGTVSHAIVSNIDLYPTLLDIVGLGDRVQRLENPIQFKQARIDHLWTDGVSLLPVLTGKSKDPDRHGVFLFYPHGPVIQSGVAVRHGKWKLIKRFAVGANMTSEFELYNLAEDIGESSNLADNQKNIVSNLDKMIKDFLKNTHSLIPRPNPYYNHTEAVMKGLAK